MFNYLLKEILNISFSFWQSALCVQNIRSILLKNKELENVTEGSMLKRLVSSVCRSVSHVTVCSASWDRQVCFLFILVSKLFTFAEICKL